MLPIKEKGGIIFSVEDPFRRARGVQKVSLHRLYTAKFRDSFRTCLDKLRFGEELYKCITARLIFFSGTDLLKSFSVDMENLKFEIRSNVKFLTKLKWEKSRSLKLCRTIPEAKSITDYSL